MRSKSLQGSSRMIITPDSFVYPVRNITEAEIEGDTVVMNLDTGAYVGLSGTGMHIWALLKTSQNVADVVASLVAKYHVDRSVCLTETIAFCDKLQESQIVMITSGLDH